MAYPTTPKRLQVIDRVVALLQAIHEGTDYFYTAYEVVKRAKHFNECGGFPTYMVFMGGESEPEQHLDSENVVKMTLSVSGWVNLELGEPQSKLLKAIRDVQKAIDTDAKSTTAGSLGVLCANGLVDIGKVETDNGGFSAEGFAAFTQDITVSLIGQWGEL
jgi:hypothetical protein